MPLKIKLKKKPSPVFVQQKLRQVDNQTKKAISIRLDAEVIDWFKANAPGGYQSEINKVLNEYVEAQTK